MGDVLTGSLSRLTRMTTPQGRAWATVALDEWYGSTNLKIPPDAFQAVGEHLVDGIEATISARPNGVVTAMTVAGHHWAEPSVEELVLADAEARKEIDAYLTVGGKGAVYLWNGAVRCVVNRVADDETWADFTMTQGGSSWGKRMSLPLDESFVRVDS